MGQQYCIALELLNPITFPGVFTDQDPRVLSTINSEAFLEVKTSYGQKKKNHFNIFFCLLDLGTLSYG